MTFDKYLGGLDCDTFNVRREKVGNKEYCYYEWGDYDVFEADSNGNYTVESYDTNNNLISIRTGDDIGNYESRNANGNIIESKEIKTDNCYIVTQYNDDGNPKDVYVHKNTDEFMHTSYEKDGSYTISTGSYGCYTETSSYNANDKLISIVESNYIDKTELKKDFISDHITHERFIKSNKVKFYRNYLDNDILNEKLYDYYDNGRVKSITITDNSSNIKRKENHFFDPNGNEKVIYSFYEDGKLIANLNDPITDVSKSKDGTETLFYGSYTSPYLVINKNGDKIYNYYDDQNKTENKLVLKADGTSEIIDANGKSHSIITHIDENSHIIYTDENNIKYEHNSVGQLVKKEIDGVIYEFNNKTSSLSVNKNGKITHSLINHIEYDEETYELIMKKLLSISDNYPSLINNDYSSCDEVINSFEDKYSSAQLSNSKNDALKTINTINELENSINYSLLAYSTCNKVLEDKLHVLIDSLFDETETALARVFKNDIKNNIEDADNDKILEYKADTNFSELCRRVIPVDNFTDEDGNIWYYNLNRQLVGVIGDNPKITYGGAGNEMEFKVQITDNGLIKLIDSNGNPLNIFGDYNMESGQYGGDQTAFSNNPVLLSNQNIMHVLDKYFDEDNNDERYKFLNRVNETGCGYIAMTNAVFKEFEGNEDGFYNTFGYPMYSLTRRMDGKMTIDYNYEPLTLDLYCKTNERDKDLASTTSKYSRAIYISDWFGMYKYLHQEYGMFEDDSLDGYNNYVKNTGMFADAGYDLYRLDGTMYYPNGEAHAMYKISELEDGKWIVSSWGKKLICNPKTPDNGTIDENSLH